MRDIMPVREQYDSATRKKRVLLLLSALLAVVLVGFVALRVVSVDTPAATAPTAIAASSASTETTTVSNSKADVVDRLREILQIRERALTERDASLFEDIYSSNCSCLRAGRNAVAALRREGVLWKDRSISLDVQSTNRISGRLWEVVALFVSSPFRIETEEGKLVRESPAERIRYRFLLVRTSDSEPFRLGAASPIEG
jgi:hypothetical protein